MEFAYGSTHARNLIEICIKIVYYMSVTFLKHLSRYQFHLLNFRIF